MSAPPVNTGAPMNGEAPMPMFQMSNPVSATISFRMMLRDLSETHFSWVVMRPFGISPHNMCMLIIGFALMIKQYYYNTAFRCTKRNESNRIIDCNRTPPLRMETTKPQ